eukprot:CAMPEP_0116147746 /NCGR_PEP_ID=MMETSP0329-20121206/17935_1 /TAXON_ID=697910 /ORGANISM="Pseudo-nitzschia arenysensis, Strain B593" /LENGTH=863 /DNA_ID=CAMNT_0003643727 /DNA_START=141 /DNA_END=2732 /DNA_ORIENTATION=+
MWGAITKDFGEFVSTVAADATETLESIDQTLDEPLVKGRGRNTDDGDGDDTNTAESEALIDPDTGIPLASVAAEEAPQSFAETPWKSPTEASLEEMKERLLVSCEDVFLDALESNIDTDTDIDTDIDTFLKDFDVATKTEEISELLKSDAALQTTFSMLSDSVSYADFWTRYFYRIDNPERLPETYSYYYQKHLEAVPPTPEQPARATMGGLTSFLGGVVSKLTHESDTDGYADTSGIVDESMDQTTVDSSGEDGAVAAARSALGFLSTVAGTGGRPPFVMNTAVSDDDEEYEDGDDDDDDDELNQPPEDDDDDDEDSEVELGWDDDDDEDFDGLDDDEDEDEDEDEDNNDIHSDEIAFQEGDDRSETVDFKDAEKEGLLEELEQARAERDALQKTVQMQAEELKMATVTSSPAPPAPTSTGDASTEALKLQLFEKDAELAALRSKLDDKHDDDDDDDDNVDKDEHDTTNELKAQLENLQKALDAKDCDFGELKKATQAQTKALEQKLQEQSAQQEELEELRQKLDTRHEEFEQLQTTKEDEASKLRHKVEEKQAEKEEMVLALQSQIYALKRQLEESKDGNSEESQDVADELRQALASKEAENSMLQAKADSAISRTKELQSQLDAKTIEVEAAISKTKDLQAQLDAKNQEVEVVTSTTRELESKLAAKTSEVETAKCESQQLQTTISDLQAQLQAKTHEAENASGDASEDETRFADLQAQIAEKERSKKSLETKVLGLQNDLSALKLEGDQKLQASAVQHEATTSNLEGQVSSLTNDLESSKKETFAANQEVEVLRSELSQLRASLERPTSPGSSSTGVRVDVPQETMPAAPAPPATPNAAVSLGLEPSENDDEDGWGDDW